MFAFLLCPAGCTATLVQLLMWWCWDGLDIGAGGISGTGDVFMASGDIFMARSMFAERRCGAATLDINGCCTAGALERAMWGDKTFPFGAKERS